MSLNIELRMPKQVVPNCFLCLSNKRKRKKIVFRTTQRRWVCKECLNALGENQIQQMLERIPLAEDAVFKTHKEVYPLLAEA